MASQDVLFEFLHSEIVSYCFSKEKYVSNLEYLGYDCGYRIIERLTKDLPRFKTELDIFKFLCIDFWSAIYKKQIDNLRTNHQGTYELYDNDFRFLNRISATSQYLESAPQYVTFTCGLIRGALTNLGIMCIVYAETHSMPTCKFNVEIQRP